VLWNRNCLFRIWFDFGKVSGPVTNPQMDRNSDHSYHSFKKKKFVQNLAFSVRTFVLHPTRKL
jgi:hypothetical protein